MKALLLGFLLFWPLDSFALESIVIAGHGCGGGQNAAATAGLDTTGGDLIKVAVSWYSAAATPVITGTIGGVSDGNTYTQVGTVQDDGTTTKQVMFYAKNANVGMTHVLTSTRSGPGYQSICVLTVAGSNLSAPLDQNTGSSVGLGLQTTIQPGLLTPGEDDEIIVTAVSISLTSTMAINSGFTISDQINYSAGNYFGTAMAYLIETAATAKNPTWDSQNISPQPFASTIDSMKKAGGGGGGVTSRNLPTMGAGGVQ